MLKRPHGLRCAILAAIAIPIVVMAGFSAEPTKAEKDDRSEARKELFDYLAEKCGRKPSGRSGPPAGKLPRAWTWEQYKTNEKNPKMLYYHISEHLQLVDKRYLSSKDEQVKRQGLGILVEACRCAYSRLKDQQLAKMICEVYLEPNLELADPRPWKYIAKPHIRELMASVYAELKDAPKLTEIYRKMVEEAPDRNTADGARLRLAQMLDRQERYEEAIKVLKEIDDHAGVEGGKRLISVIERKLKDKQGK
jgi:hypothetical protein